MTPGTPTTDTPDARTDAYRRALDADVQAALAGWPPLTARQCDRIAVLLWPRHPLAGHGGTSPPRAA